VRFKGANLTANGRFS
jgi:putative addiction module component (TIGR02574 family)